MTEIRFEVKDDIVKDYGELYIKKFFNQQLDYLRLHRLMDKIEAQIKASGMDYEKELERIREQAWQESKKDFLH